MILKLSPAVVAPAVDTANSPIDLPVAPFSDPKPVPSAFECTRACAVAALVKDASACISNI